MCCCECFQDVNCLLSSLCGVFCICFEYVLGLVGVLGFLVLCLWVVWSC